MNITPRVPFVNGWLDVKLSEQVMEKLWSYINKENIPKNNGILAGNLEHEFALEDTDNWFFNEVLLELIDQYTNYFSPLGDNVAISDPRYFGLLNFWVNKQKKLEFNPVHTHSGVFSFVIWMKIPTDWKEEFDLPFVKDSNYPCASNFVIHYNDLTGGILSEDFRMDKDREGTMIFFPSGTPHEVHPFYTSDEDRISISGNLSLIV